MGPKRADNVGRGHKPSHGNIGLSGAIGGMAGEQEYQQCVGKFAADLELCCRESPSGYPITIPVYIRGHPPPSAQIQSLPLQNQNQQQSGTHSGTSVTPSLAGGNVEEQSSIPLGKRTSRARIPSASQSGILVGITSIENDTRSLSIPGQEPSKTSSSSLYKTFHLVHDSDFFRPKLLVDSIGIETDSIDQIAALYMRAWQLDHRFIEILKKVLPFQEQLHTLHFCFVGIIEHTMHGVVELCQVIKNLKNVSLDGNPLAAEYFHLLIEKDDSKIVHLSLRYCNITDTGAEKLAHSLGNMYTQNWKLLTLNLSGNRIGDVGAKSFATALRYNRTLISLNLSSNFITDKGAFPLALVLRRIVLTEEEIIRRRYLLSERYAETHPEETRNNASSPTPSNVSTKSKAGRTDWKRTTDSNKRKSNSSKIAQIVTDKRNRPESVDENRPPSENKGDAKRGRNEGSTSRSSTLNPPSATGASARRSVANTSATSNKDSDQSRTSGPARVKKIAAVVNASAKKNIPIVKEEDENGMGELISLQIHQIDHENPLFEVNEIESHDGELWLKGNFTLLNLNLSRNYLTLETVNEFLLSIQQQSALTHFNEALHIPTTTATSSADFSGLCRLELKGMNDISTKSHEYQLLETSLIQKNPSNRFQQIRERESKELLDSQLFQPSQPTMLDKSISTSEKTRAGSSLKTSNPRPSSRLKD